MKGGPSSRGGETETLSMISSTTRSSTPLGVNWQLYIISLLNNEKQEALIYDDGLGAEGTPIEASNES